MTKVEELCLGSSRNEDDDRSDTGDSSGFVGSEKGDSPADLIRKEDRALFILRILTIVLLIVATAVTATMVYIFSAKAEEDAYERSFQELSGKLIESFLEESRKKFWNGRAISASINSYMIATGASPWNLTVPLWEEITEQARIVSDCNVVAWSPFLYTREQLDAFTSFTINETGGDAPSPGANPPCYICGGPDMTVTNPDVKAPLGGLFFPCSDMEGAGRGGSISRCDLVLDAVKGICECGPVPADQVELPPRKTSEGMWMIDDTQSELAIDDNTNPPWNPMWLVGIRGETKPTFLYNQMSEPVRRRALEGMLKHKVPSFSEIYTRKGAYYKNYLQARIGETITNLVYPVFALDSDEVIGSLVLEMLWGEFLPEVFPPDSELLDIVIENTCGQNYTFRIDDEKDILGLIGEGDLHERELNDIFAQSTFEQFDDVVRFASGKPPEPEAVDVCRYRFFVYPTMALKDQYVTNEPIVYTMVVVVIFLGTSLVFLIYDWIVRRRQKKVLDRAMRTGAIVASLFPQNVRNRLYNAESKDDRTKGKAFRVGSPKTHIQSYLSDKAVDLLGSEPLADLFPNTTTCFLDIAGFTSWSSERNPEQVFVLLETVYAVFDEIAERRGIFKVETIGDSYVAAAGLPATRRDHAVAIVRFAYECLRRFEHVVKEMEVQLGPSTGELRARCGVHSGPVTAGVLRGAKARFQLFGDSMNMTARLESTGTVGKIHVSKATADLLSKAGKGAWVSPRSDLVVIKGKGELQTYWINPKASAGSNHSGSCSSDMGDDWGAEEDVADVAENKFSRLVDWNVQVLYSLLKKVVNQRSARNNSTRKDLAVAESGIINKPGIVFDEVTEILNVAPFHTSQTNNNNQDNVDLGDLVKEELRKFVSQMAETYHDVPFHCFEHASHVTMSAGKLMKRIVNPDGIDYGQPEAIVAKEVHNLTYGISSDPLMQFSIVFAALIHDADHTGLPNGELVKMGTPAAHLYKGRSVAEQNSVDVAWKMLASNHFANLRGCIYANVDELRRFRQLVVNAVLATDIADKELQQLRKERWTRAFDQRIFKDIHHDSINIDRRATIVFEYILQASDIAHTMQHWHTYVKWNERLFHERYKAYLSGHEAENPLNGWYQGEIGFFKFYIIPLAKKLKECGVFGVSHAEYLTYAEANLAEWEHKGRDISEGMHERAISKYGTCTLEKPTVAGNEQPEVLA